MANPDKNPDPDRQNRQESHPSEPRKGSADAKSEAFGFLSMANLGLEMGGVILLMTLIGWWIDGKLGSSPWCLITGVVIGLVGSLYKVFRAAKQVMGD